MSLKETQGQFANSARKGKTVKLMIAGVLVACALGAAVAHADTVTDWNAIMQATVSAPPTNPFFQARWSAIVQLAVFEAVNAIEGDYEPYLGIIAAPPWASPDAAAVAAAHRTLVMLRPGSAAALDAARDVSLAAIANGPEKDAGIAVGQAAADAMLLLRAGDGWDANPPYTPGTDPGDWRPTPPALAPASLVQWRDVTPFGLRDGSQFRLPPPPGLNTGRYANDYNEVKLLGRFDSQVRPQDRTDVARFYGATTPVQVFNSAARQVSAAQGDTLAQNARTFARLAMAICDASIAIFDTKYHYNFWRPVTAIRAGDTDGNQQTDPDPTWLPLITTPAFPGYASAHGSLSGAARAVLEWTFGKDGLAITLTNPTLPGIVLNYTAWDQITDDISDARVYGGIHFRFDQEAGAYQGKHVGFYILRNYLRSLDDLDDSDDYE
ncbi:MAG TPA: vanadium-dependent haloperoxidase [Gemmataceae bacterium]|nr:vanadium-dependent haloperoxidase [Gemmataceae bacterium]